MRFARDHTHNRTTHRKGDPFVGSVNTGRFLYQRGVLESDGGPDDPLITSRQPPGAWHDTNQDSKPSDPEPDPTSAWGAPQGREE